MGRKQKWHQYILCGIGEVIVNMIAFFAVSCYASGTDFLTAAGKEHFDLVFLDIYMGNENGVDAAEHLRRFQDILYAKHYQHQIYVYSAGGKKYVTRQTFREFTAALTDERFFLCSRGALVNMEHAEDFDGTDFILKSGKRISVSRDLAKAARTAFGDYLFKGFQNSGRRD